MSTPLPGTADDPERQRPTRKIDQAFEEIAKLSGTDVAPTVFFQDFLRITLTGIEAPAGAIWLRNPQGFLQLQCQERIDDVGLDRHKNGRQSHNELLRQAFQTAKPILLEPFGSTGILEGIPAGNPTDYVVYLAPVLLDEKTAVGLVEVWQEPRWDARMKRVHLNFVVQMAGYASTYVRNQQSRQTLNQEQLWTQLEAFAVQIHSTLDPTIASYHVANEGRRLIGCDRLSVAFREGKRAKIEAVSGSDVVEKRSAQIKRMRELCEAVFQWDEKLVYRGVKDEGLPPKVHETLDAYLAESQAKLLVVMPLRDPRERDKETKEYRPGKSRSALVMESFDPPAQPEPLFGRLDVIARHSAGALFNSAEMRSIPMGWLWRPIRTLQEGLGGKARSMTALIGMLVLSILVGLVVIPYELKLDATGQMLPEERRYLFSPTQATIGQFNVEPRAVVARDQVLVAMYDRQLDTKVRELIRDISISEEKVKTLNYLISKNVNPPDLPRYMIEHATETVNLNSLRTQLDSLKRLFNADLNSPGWFFLLTPPFDDRARSRDPQWIVLSGKDFRESLGKTVNPDSPILRIGEVNNNWEIELKVPQKHMGQLISAFKSNDPEEYLIVDLKLKTRPTESYKGLLRRKNISPEAVPNKDEHSETEPVVYAHVQLSDPMIAEPDRVPREALIPGVEVSTRIRCGLHSSGYSLFYGVWDFVCEKWFSWF